MKQLWNKFLPFATDSTGVCSVFCDADAVVIGNDPGATVNRCYQFTEKRQDRYAHFQGVHIKESECIMGKNDELLDLYAMAVEHRPDAEAVVIVGSPVSSMLNLNMDKLGKQLENRCGIPVLGFDTSGNYYYDKGISTALIKLFERFEKDNQLYKPNKNGAFDDSGDVTIKVNLLGLNTLDYPWDPVREYLNYYLEDAGYEILSVWGTDTDFESMKHCLEADFNIICSVSGMKLAQKMKEEYKIPFMTLDACGIDNAGSGLRFPKDASVLIVGEQISANMLRRRLIKDGAGKVTVAGFFQMEKDLMKKGDVKLYGEDDLIELLKKETYSLIIGDGLIIMLKEYFPKTPLYEIMHPPVSGMYNQQVYSNDPLDPDFWMRMYEAACFGLEG